MRRRLFVLASLIAMPVGAATHLWSGAASERLSDPGNWTNGSPVGDATADLDFPPNALRKSVVNDVDDVPLRLVGFSGSGYTISGKRMRVLEQIADASWSSDGNAIANDIDIGANLTIDATPGSVLTLTGAIHGPGNVTKRTIGLVVFAGTAPNDYAGATRVMSGTLRLEKNAAIPPHALALMQQATLDLGGHTTVIGPLTLSAAASIVNGPIVLAGDVVVTADAGELAASLTDVVLTETRTITIAADATLWLNGVSGPPDAGLVIDGGAQVVVDGSYAGPTTLAATAATIRNAATAVTVNGGATLSGSTGPVVSHGGTIADVDVTGALQLDRASTFAPTTGIGVVRVTGAIDLGDALLVYPGLSAPGARTTLIENIGGAPVRGAFSALAEGAVTPDRHYRISYNGGAGRDVVLTDVSRLPMTMSAYTDNQDTVFLGGTKKVTAEITVIVFTSAAKTWPAMSGTLTVRDRDGNVIGRGAVSSYKTTVTITPLRPGRYNATVDYSGDDFFSPATAKVALAVSGPRATIDSFTPNSLVQGVPTELVIKGSGFVEPITLWNNLTTYRARLVSPNEVRATVVADDILNPAYLAVVNADGDPSYSPSVVLKVVPSPPSPLSIVFGPTTATAGGIPGTTTYWLRSDGRENVIETDAFVGIARWDLFTPPAAVTWGVIDSNGNAAVAHLFGTPIRTSAANLLQVGLDGKLSRLEIEGQNAQVLWVRPGVGAWHLTTSPDGTNRAADAHPLRGSPPPPGAFAPGDVLLALIGYQNYSLLRVTETSPQLVPEIAVTLPYVVYEGDLARITVQRLHGSATTSLVHYDVTPPPNVNDVLPAHGTLTFAPGEFLKNIIVETRDDHREGGSRVPTDFEAEGAAMARYPYNQQYPDLYVLDAPAAEGVEVRIDDVRVIEGDFGVRQAMLTATLSEPRAYATSVGWSRDDGSGSGGVPLAAGQLRARIAIPFVANTTAEGDRTIGVTLGSSTGYLAKAHGVVKIIDDDGPRLTIDDVTASDAATFTVTLLRAAAQPVGVSYRTVDVSARAGSDYVATAGTLAFAPGETRKTITIPLLRGAGRFAVVLTDANVPLAKSAGIAIIAGNAPALPALAIGDGTATAGKTITVAVRLSAPAALPVSVRYATFDGTAMAPHDYLAASGTLSFAPGEVEKTIDIATVEGGGGTFFVVLSEATAPIERGTGLCVIGGGVERRRAAR